ncbi:UNVERIFIED_CONTAM: hypothetical protein GTU68_026381 [Idotea baltica]|nr:hypothetical protein [Idotea baltica]
MVRSILRNVGYKNINQAVNGRMAVTDIRDTEIAYDLIICDWNMPGLTGLDVLKKVRDDEKTKDVPFLILTAEAEKEKVNAAIQNGVSDFLLKPFTPGILVEKVKQLLS